MVYREREARQKAESDRDAAIKRAIEADADREHVREQFESVCSQLHDAQRDRDAALSAMWGLICVASNRENQSAEWRGVAMMNLDRIYQERQEHWNELDRLRASVSLQARDGH